MTPAQNQLAKEAGFDVRVGLIGLAVFFGCLLVLPRFCFWFYFLPLAAFWFRYLWVRNKRDDELLRADLAASGRLGAAGCYAGEAGICITDGTHHVLVARHDAKAPLQLPYIVGRK